MENRLLFLVCYAIIEKEMFKRGDDAMAQESVLDRAIYQANLTFIASKGFDVKSSIGL